MAWRRASTGLAVARQADNKGLVPGSKFFSPYPFAGMNVQASPIAVADQEFVYVENFIRVGDGNYRTAWDKGTALYAATGGLTIVSFFFYTIGLNYYVVVFLSDGSAVQINAQTAVVTPIGAGFYDPSNGNLPATTQWGTQYLLIANTNTSNDYWIWDGALLYGAGGAAPAGVDLLSNGQNYSSLPTVTVYGGHGSGMVLQPTINAGGVVQLAIIDPGTGYEVGDIAQVAFSGGGSDDSAILEANLDAGGVAGANVTAQGNNYTTATAVFSGGGGSGAAGVGVIGYAVNTVNVTASGTGYTTATATIVRGMGDTTGSGALVSVTLAAGGVSAISVVNGGSNYTVAPNVVISGDGVGATATTTVHNGKVIGITITSPGTGYTSAPTINITGDGAGATAVAILSPGGISGVTVVNPGTGFLYAPNISFVGGGGTGATGTVFLNGTSIARVNVVASGANYQDVPSIIILGGGAGTGAVLTPIMLNGGVVAVRVDNGGSGYSANPELLFQAQAGDTGSGAAAVVIFAPTSIAGVIMSNYGTGYTDAPAVEIAPGANNSAYAVVELMPFGISGDAIETFQQRVWIVGQTPAPYIVNPATGNFAVSAPGSLTDFATSDGGVLFTNSDRFLQTRYTNLRQSNGYLYFMGDGSVSVVSNVQVSGTTAATTTFNYQNVDPQVGVSWRDSVQDFGRTILMGNETGVYGLYGGSVNKVSNKLDQLFTDAVFPASGGLLPSSAVATLFNIKHYLMLMTFIDPDTVLPVNKMVTWNERDWVITSQTLDLTYIGQQKVSSKLYAWGTDGAALYPLFNRPSSTLAKRLDTKYYGAPQSYMVKQMDSLYVVVQDKSGAGVNITASYVVSGITAQERNFEQTQNGIAVTDADLQPTLSAPIVAPPYWSVFGALIGDFPFSHVGARLTTTSPDFVLGNLIFSYADLQAVR